MTDRTTMNTPDLRPCWTCRERNFAEITHTSDAYAGKLFRCVNCKAIYPDVALIESQSSPTADEKPTCATCGKDVAEVLCPYCAKWWADNPPGQTVADDRAAVEAEVIERAYKEGWMVNAIPPEEHEAGASYVHGCCEVDWQASASRAAIRAPSTPSARTQDHG
jgi:hypothetical protein